MVEKIEYCIGRTPLMKVWSRGDVNIYAKMENYNLSGSIKDRTAYWMIKNAERKGILKEGKGIVEPSSGNTGISLAMFGAMKGYKVIIIMPKYATKERKLLISRYGGKVIEIDDLGWRHEAIDMAREITKQNPEFVFLNQYENDSNWVAHYETTGQEIVQEMVGKVDYFIAGIGTGGTLVGVAKKLKIHYGDVKIIGVQPKEGDRIQGLKNIDEDMSAILKNNIDIIDEFVDVSSREAIGSAYQISKNGYLVGHSSGAVFNVALKYAKKIKKGNIVVIFPDSGDRYIY